MHREPINDRTHIHKPATLCAGLAQSYAIKQINFQVYASNVTDIMIDGSQKYWGDCSNTIRPGNYQAYMAYLREYVEDHSFMPLPCRLLFGSETYDEIKKKLLRPIYVGLVDLAKKRVRGVNPGSILDPP